MLLINCVWFMNLKVLDMCTVSKVSISEIVWMQYICFDYPFQYVLDLNILLSLRKSHKKKGNRVTQHCHLAWCWYLYTVHSTLADTSTCFMRKCAYFLIKP